MSMAKYEGKSAKSRGEQVISTGVMVPTKTRDLGVWTVEDTTLDDALGI